VNFHQKKCWKKKGGGGGKLNLKLIIPSWEKVQSVKKRTGAAKSRYLKLIKHWSSVSNRHWTESKNPLTPSIITHICNMQYYIVTVHKTCAQSHTSQEKMLLFQNKLKKILEARI